MLILRGCTERHVWSRIFQINFYFVDVDSSRVLPARVLENSDLCKQHHPCLYFWFLFWYLFPFKFFDLLFSSTFLHVYLYVNGGNWGLGKKVGNDCDLGLGKKVGEKCAGCAGVRVSGLKDSVCQPGSVCQLGLVVPRAFDSKLNKIQSTFLLSFLLDSWFIIWLTVGS